MISPWQYDYFLMVLMVMAGSEHSRIHTVMETDNVQSPGSDEGHAVLNLSPLIRPVRPPDNNGLMKRCSAALWWKEVLQRPGDGSHSSQWEESGRVGVCNCDCGSVVNVLESAREQE